MTWMGLLQWQFALRHRFVHGCAGLARLAGKIEIRADFTLFQSFVFFRSSVLETEKKLKIYNFLKFFFPVKKLKIKKNLYLLFFCQNFELLLNFYSETGIEFLGEITVFKKIKNEIFQKNFFY